MSYGLEVYSPTGALVFDTDSIAVMQVDNFGVAANETVTKTYPEFINWEITALIELVDQPPGSQEHYSPVAFADGSTGTVIIQPQGGLPSFAARVIVLARDV
jgi:hypothetical protein